MRLSLPLSLAALATLAACADSQPPDQTPLEEDGAYNMVDPVRAPLADETQPALGEWVETLQEEQPALQFGPTGTEPLFSIRCDDREGLLLFRHGTVASGDTMMVVTIGSSSQRLAVNPVQGPVPVMRAAVPAGDNLLSQLRETAEPVRIDVGDGPSLLLPASPAIGEFIRSCSESPPEALAEPVEANSAE